MKNYIVILLTCVSAVAGMAQTNEVLNNKSIVELTKAGVSKKIILSKIETSACKFTTDTKSLISLKKDGVDEDVVNAMVSKSSGGTTATAASSSSTSTTAGKETTTPATAKDDHVSALPAAKAIALLKKEGSGIYYLQ